MASKDTKPEICTAIDRDWEDGQPHMLMHPPCACSACAPAEVEADAPGWLRASGTEQRRRVEAARLGRRGSELLG